MKLFGDTQKTLAIALNLSETTVNLKINESNGAEFVQSEIKAIKERYCLTVEEVDAIFFAEKSN